MAQSNKDTRAWRERLKNKYRLVIMQDETLELKSSVKLSMLNVFIAISTVFVVFTAFIVGIIYFTPLKDYIAGYEKIEQTRQLLEMEQTTDSLMRVMDEQRNWILNLNRVLNGELDTIQDIVQSPSENYSSIKIDEVSNEDLRLREEVAEADFFRLNAGSGNQPRLKDVLDAHFYVPLEGVVTDTLNKDEKHYGVDIVATENSPVMAVLDGTVVDTYWDLETGNVIVIQHDDNLISLYKHNSVLLKKVGTFVKAGDAIAVIGNTGELSSGPHLHFEMWHDRAPLNPADFILFN